MGREAGRAGTASFPERLLLSKKMSKHIPILLLLLAFLSGSCEKADDYEPSPRANFEALWKILDENYCFFSYKNIDWDEVYRRYEPLITDTMSQVALFDTLASMANELRDGHVNLSSSFNTSRYWDWYLDYPDNFDADIQENYLGRDYAIAGGLEYTTLDEGRVGYLYYGSFSSSASENALDYALLSFKDCLGLILDIRDNGGGLLSNSERIAARFAERKTLTGYIQHKTGPGHDDFSEPTPVYVEPSERTRWLRPVVLLTNRQCYSAANDFTQRMRELPFVVTMGDRTGGGSGLPFTSELPNGWSIRFSASPMLDPDKRPTEFGISPDIPVSMTAEDEERGLDTIIERAIRYINDYYANRDTAAVSFP